MSDSNPLAPDALSQLLVDLTSHDGHAVQIDSPVTALALLAHTIHTALGFRLTKPASVTEPASDDPQQRNRLAHEWIASKSHDESFSFTYTHTQSSMVFEVRINRLGNRVVFNALGVEDDKTATLDVLTSDYVSRSAFPHQVNTSSFSFGALFNSPSRLHDLITSYKIQIIQKLIIGLHKPGYEEERDSRQGGGTAPPPNAGPSAPRPRPDHPEGEPDRGIGSRPTLPGIGGPSNPLEIGRSDLDPLGGAMGRLPGAGGDGMLVGPNHPLFQREREQYDPLRIPGTGGQGNRGPWGGDGFLPPLGAPPGARFDPVGPFAPGNAGGQPRRNWGDEMPPPGFDNEGGAGRTGAFNPHPLNPRGGGFGVCEVSHASQIQADAQL
ncbi:hypothetical protein EMMF5_001255 [Cystobasidiomycetes sp. EMM_F5]